MASDSRRDFFRLRPRRRTGNLLLQPGLQLRLPAYLLLVTAVFGAVSGAHAWLAYERLVAMALEDSSSPGALKALFRAQTADFLYVSGLLLAGYVVATLAVAIVLTHRMVGPAVAIRRQIEALRRGDHSARVTLRKRDAFKDVARELNALAETLEKRSVEGATDS